MAPVRNLAGQPAVHSTRSERSPQTPYATATHDLSSTTSLSSTDTPLRLLTAPVGNIPNQFGLWRASDTPSAQRDAYTGWHAGFILQHRSNNVLPNEEFALTAYTSSQGADAMYKAIYALANGIAMPPLPEGVELKNFNMKALMSCDFQVSMYVTSSRSLALITYHILAIAVDVGEEPSKHQVQVPHVLYFDCLGIFSSRKKESTGPCWRTTNSTHLNC